MAVQVVLLLWLLIAQCVELLLLTMTVQIVLLLWLAVAHCITLHLLNIGHSSLWLPLLLMPGQWILLVLLTRYLVLLLLAETVGQPCCCAWLSGHHALWLQTLPRCSQHSTVDHAANVGEQSAQLLQVHFTINMVLE